MKKIILNFKKLSNNYKELVQEAFNKDILDFIVSKESYLKFKNIDRLKIYSMDPEVQPDYLIYDDIDKLENLLAIKEKSSKKVGAFIEIKSKADVDMIIKVAKSGKVDLVMVSTKNWKIIPFENLIAQIHSYDTELIGFVEDIQEAETLLKTLEIGVDGIVITPNNIIDLIDLKKLTYSNFHIELTTAKVTKIQNLPECDRVCVDTTSILKLGEGMLVGSTAKGFLLIHSETIESQFVATRPFRVNAGDVSAYILVPDDDPERLYRTNYLSELKGGDKVIVVNTDGDVRIVTIGRIKVETRPMIRFELEALVNDNKIKFSGVCQNAETIRLVNHNRNPISVVDIERGDEVLVHIGPGATHFGTIIKENIIEK
ncbi:MAG: 3-dehydroquinate synthase II [Candidatus Hodarchaeota archaeon]